MAPATQRLLRVALAIASSCAAVCVNQAMAVDAAAFSQSALRNITTESTHAAPLEAAESESPSNDAELDTAAAHLDAGAIDQAIHTYRSAILRIQRTSGANDPQLVPALTGLGKALARDSQLQPAEAALERAVQISRRAGGLFDLSQIEALETLASLNAEQARFETSDALYRYIVQIHEQQFGSSHLSTAAAIGAMARFKAAIGHYLDARNLYQRAILVIESARGEASPELIEPLCGLADVYRREALGIRDFEPRPEMLSAADEATLSTRTDLLSAGARKYAYSRKLHPAGFAHLNRALRIAQRDEALVEPKTYHSLLVQIGDWLLLARRPETAMPYYQRAASLPTAQLPGAQTLEQVAPIYLALPDEATRHKWQPRNAVRETFALIAFDVSPKGRVENIRVIDSDASASDRRAAIRAMRLSIYRPRFADGTPRATKDVQYRIVFRKRI